MKLTKLVDGVKVDLTTQEIASFNQREIDHQKFLIELGANQYQKDRQRSFAPIGDQLDMIWHTIDKGLPLDKTSPFYLYGLEVKQKFPKTN